MVARKLNKYVAFSCNGVKIVRETKPINFANYYVYDIILDYSTNTIELKEAVVSAEKVFEAELEDARVVYRAHVNRNTPGGVVLITAFEKAFNNLRPSNISKLRRSIVSFCLQQ